MFDFLNVNNKNKEMALMVIRESYKKGIKLNISFEKDMSVEDKDKFLELAKK